MSETSNVNCYSSCKTFMQNQEAHTPTKKGIALLVGEIAISLIALSVGTLVLLAALHRLPQGLACFSALGSVGMGAGSAFVGLGGLLLTGGAGLTIALAISYCKKTEKNREQENEEDSDTSPNSTINSFSAPKAPFRNDIVSTSDTNLTELPQEIIPLISQLSPSEFSVYPLKEDSYIIFGVYIDEGQKKSWAYAIPTNEIDDYVQTNLNVDSIQYLNIAPLPPSKENGTTNLDAISEDLRTCFSHLTRINYCVVSSGESSVVVLSICIKNYVKHIVAIEMASSALDDYVAQKLKGKIQLPQQMLAILNPTKFPPS